MNDGPIGLGHISRQLEKLAEQLDLAAEQTKVRLDSLIDLGMTQVELLASINDRLLPPEVIGAVTGKLLFYAHGEKTPMDTFSPKTIVDFVAEFDKADGTVGSIDGPAVVTDDNANDVVTVTDDGSGDGTCKGTIDGTKNVGAATKEVSNITVTGDGNLGPGVAPIVLTGAITWDSDVTGATSGKVTFTAEPATPAQAAAFRKAVAARK